ncbi:MAG: phosphoribosylglycinamide formyltransferase [Maribacter sp.]|nr:phosphoribosylglycinamide formyltransferase [Maribacter sp.]
MKRIVLFASGSGSNVENIVEYFTGHPEISITCVLSNKRDAYVLDRCNKLGVPAFYFNKAGFTDSRIVLQLLKCIEPDLIVLAGFLLKIPSDLVKAFPNRIINIHPALLPKYGGKGMYGKHVHTAVKAQGESESGITIHYVNEQYDEGAIIRQFKVQISEEDTVDQIMTKVQSLEHTHFPGVIEDLLLGR